MKKQIRILCVAAVLVLSLLPGPCPAQAEGGCVVASFYPICIFAENVIGDTEGIQLSCLASNTTGCLHDYQLAAGDMVALSRADLFLINGAGMEGFLDVITDSLPALTVADCSQGIDLLANPEGAETEYNAHVWLDPANAVRMTETICGALSDAFPEHADAFRQNASAYIQRLTELDALLKTGCGALARRDIVTFHEAFPYFAKAYGLNVVAVIALEPDEGISPRMLSELSVKVREAGCPPLFTEPQYPSDAAEALSRETGAPIYALDPVVTGDFDPASYETAMLNNLKVLEEALGH